MHSNWYYWSAQITELLKMAFLNIAKVLLGQTPNLSMANHQIGGNHTINIPSPSPSQNTGMKKGSIKILITKKALFSAFFSELSTKLLTSSIIFYRIFICQKKICSTSLTGKNHLFFEPGSGQRLLNMLFVAKNSISQSRLLILIFVHQSVKLESNARARL